MTNIVRSRPEKGLVTIEFRTVDELLEIIDWLRLQEMTPQWVEGLDFVFRIANQREYSKKLGFDRHQIVTGLHFEDHEQMAIFALKFSK